MDPRRSFQGARCLVTGASTRLGRTIAEQLALEGARVLMTGGPLEQLEATARALDNRGIRPGAVLAIDADLSGREGRCKVIHAAARRFGALDLAVQLTTLPASEPDILASVEMTQALLPLLKLGERPSLTNILPIAESRGILASSKGRVGRSPHAGFLDGIHEECADSGIHLLLVNAGPAEPKYGRDLLAETPSAVSRRRAKLLETATFRTLEAIRRSYSDLTLVPEARTLLRLARLARALAELGFIRRGVRCSHADPETWAGSRLTARLPRPHFGLRMNRPANKGD